MSSDKITFLAIHFVTGDKLLLLENRDEKILDKDDSYFIEGVHKWPLGHFHMGIFWSVLCIGICKPKPGVFMFHSWLTKMRLCVSLSLQLNLLVWGSLGPPEERIVRAHPLPVQYICTFIFNCIINIVAIIAHIESLISLMGYLWINP